MDSSIPPSPASVPSSTSGLTGTTSRAPSPPSSPTAPSSSTSASRATTFKATILPLRQNPHHRSFRPLLIKPLLLLLRRLLVEQPSDVCIQIQSPWCPLSSLSNIDDHLCFKYQLLGKDLDALIFVTNNEDLDHMMLEYDYLHHSTTRPTARLRNFSFIHPKKARDSTEVRCTVPIDESSDFDTIRFPSPLSPATTRDLIRSLSLPVADILSLFDLRSKDCPFEDCRALADSHDLLSSLVLFIFLKNSTTRRHLPGCHHPSPLLGPQRPPWVGMKKKKRKEKQRKKKRGRKEK